MQNDVSLSYFKILVAQFFEPGERFWAAIIILSQPLAELLMTVEPLLLGRRKEIEDDFYFPVCCNEEYHLEIKSVLISETHKSSLKARKNLVCVSEMTKTFAFQSKRCLRTLYREFELRRDNFRGLFNQLCKPRINQETRRLFKFFSPL